jgi:hypothetical protein
MDAESGRPWFIEGHVPDWLLPAMVWRGGAEPEQCSRCNPTGWRTIDE